MFLPAQERKNAKKNACRHPACGRRPFAGRGPWPVVLKIVTKIENRLTVGGSEPDQSKEKSLVSRRVVLLSIASRLMFVCLSEVRLSRQFCQVVKHVERKKHVAPAQVKLREWGMCRFGGQSRRNHCMQFPSNVF
jgi:hypothetical protein